MSIQEQCPRILLAEDCPDTQLMLSYILADEGAEVFVADDGASCVEMANAAHDQGQPFDLILMDISMPQVDGHEATRMLRKGGYNKPIVALSARSGVHDAEQSIVAGCDDHVCKLVGRKNILKAIERHLGPEVSEKKELVPQDERDLLLPIISTLLADYPSFSNTIVDFIDELEQHWDLERQGLFFNEVRDLQEVLAPLTKAEVLGFPLLSRLVHDAFAFTEAGLNEKLGRALEEIDQVIQRMKAGREQMSFEVQ